MKRIAATAGLNRVELQARRGRLDGLRDAPTPADAVGNAELGDHRPSQRVAAVHPGARPRHGTHAGPASPAVSTAGDNFVFSPRFGHLLNRSRAPNPETSAWKGRNLVPEACATCSRKTPPLTFDVIGPPQIQECVAALAGERRRRAMPAPPMCPVKGSQGPKASVSSQGPARAGRPWSRRPWDRNNPWSCRDLQGRRNLSSRRNPWGRRNCAIAAAHGVGATHGVATTHGLAQHMRSTVQPP